MRKIAVAGLVLFVACAAHRAGAPSTPPSYGAAAPGGAAARLATFFGATQGERTVMASEAKASLAEGKYFILDVRPAKDYAQGHIPGALNIPVDRLFAADSLALLPPPGGKPILLVCRTGHTASMALGGLVALGYEPWVLRWSMLAWNARSEVRIASPHEAPQPLVGLGGPLER
ncbi:MAG TPA: rhodanese-like domain-containing protein [Anaeromyxobacteraceae bacterium]|nr:rhodanese-like domain-containing protein [Anaeromyxobacteraceae bacterium]